MSFIQKAFPLNDYSIEVVFTTGEHGIADMSDIVGKGVFQRILEKNKFDDFIVDPLQQTIVWKNAQLDIAPESLYFRAFKNDTTKHAMFKQWGYME